MAAVHYLGTCMFLIGLVWVIGMTHACPYELGLRFDEASRGYSLDVKINKEILQVRPGCAGELDDKSSNGGLETVALLRDTFTDASKLLHQATRYHVHIAEVRFFLPYGWKRDITGEIECMAHSDTNKLRALEVIPYPGSITGKNCPKANIDVESCGRPSHHTGQLPLATFLQCKNMACNTPSRTLVESFAQLRWGIPMSSVLCSEGENQTLENTTGLHNESTVKFCNTSDTQQLLRNSTPNQHTAVLNNICQGRSVWDVILQHNDFHSFADWERKPNEDLRPKFRYIVECRSEATAFLMDLSASQTNFSAKARKAVLRHINSKSSDYASIALVTYGTHIRTKDHPSAIITNKRGRVFLNKTLQNLDWTGGTSATHASSLKHALKIAHSLVNGVKTERAYMRRGNLILRQIVIISERGQSIGGSTDLCSGKHSDHLFITKRCPTRILSETKRLSPTRLANNQYCSRQPGKALKQFFLERARNVFEGTVDTSKTEASQGFINVTRAFPGDSRETFCFSINVFARCSASQFRLTLDGVSKASQKPIILGKCHTRRFDLELVGPDKSFILNLSGNFQQEGKQYPVTLDVSPGPCTRIYRGGESPARQ